MTLGLKGNACVVTGGGRGIGVLVNAVTPGSDTVPGAERRRPAGGRGDRRGVTGA